jgi:hypothetical protein
VNNQKDRLSKIDPVTIKKPEKRLVYVRESALQAIISDTFSFGCLILVMTLNFAYWGGHWYLTVFLAWIWLVFILGRAKAKLREFNSRSELIDTLIKELEEEGENSK